MRLRKIIPSRVFVDGLSMWEVGCRGPYRIKQFTLQLQLSLSPNATGFWLEITKKYPASPIVLKHGSYVLAQMYSPPSTSGVYSS
jgi:hypothetical protein